MDGMYNSKLLELSGNIERIGRLDAPHGTATAHSKLCGSKITVDIQLKDDIIVDYAHEVKACALGQASASVVAKAVIGATVDEIIAGRAAAYAMLKDNTAPPEGRFSDMKYLEPVRDYKARHASTLLVFDALAKAIEQAHSSALSKSDDAVV